VIAALMVSLVGATVISFAWLCMIDADDERRARQRLGTRTPIVRLELPKATTRRKK
jgi:uncharacterized protein (DUF2062 family)